MWTTKYFKSYEKMLIWEKAHRSKYQIIQLFVNNGYALEYKKKIFIY